MTPQDKAQELIKKFDPLVYPYLGSGFMTNTEDEDVILKNAKKCANILVDEILEATVKYKAIREKVEYSKTGFDNVVHKIYDSFWLNVKKELCQD